MYDLVRAETKDGLLIRGLFVPGDKNKPAVIHIHGFQGDFYTQEFVKKIAEKLRENNTAFISVQNRGTGIESELYTNAPGYGRTGGSSYELLEEAYMDIDAWIKFLLDQGYTKVILQGHSLGTMKIVRYLSEGSHVDKVRKLILLAPFDIIQLAQDATNGKWKEYLEIAKQKVTEGKGLEIIPKEFLDVRISYQTYVSHHDNNEFEYMFAFHDKTYNFPILKRIEIPVKVVLGTDDSNLNTPNYDNTQQAVEVLKKNIKDCDVTLIKDANHSYTGFEDKITEEVLKFVEN